LSSFEFAQIPMAIILGFGITEILASWGYQLRNRGRAPWSPLHFAASAWVPPALRPLHLDPVGMARHRVDVRRLRHGRRTRVGPRARRPRREDRRGHTPVAPDLRAVPQAPVPSPRGMGRPVVGEGEPCRPSRIQPSSGRRPACSCRRSRSCWEHSRGSASAGPPPVTASGGRSSGQPRFGSRSIPIDRSTRAERTSQCSRYRRGNRRQRPVAPRLRPPPLSLREQRLAPHTWW
jgi:hypothetical protein